MTWPTRFSSDDLRETFEDRIDAIDAIHSENFREIVEAAGLRTECDLCFGTFKDVRFDRQNLSTFVFTGCDLTDSTFTDATLGDAIFDSARVDLSKLSAAKDYPAWLKRDIARSPASRHRLDARRLRDFEIFREAPFAPEMVVIPAGSFLMGSDLADLKLKGDDQAYDHEVVPGKGKRPMTIARRFAIGRAPVTFDEYIAFCEAEKREIPPDEGRGRGNRPVINVTWNEAMDYVTWLNGRLGASVYRLPSEAEWEYACRAGTTTRRWWGDTWDPKRANGARSFEKGKTSPVDHYPANHPWGLRDMVGNVWEWCADEFTEKIQDLPEGGVRHERPQKGNKSSVDRALRGGSWDIEPRGLRCAIRDGVRPEYRFDHAGFRLARTL